MRALFTLRVLRKIDFSGSVKAIAKVLGLLLLLSPAAFAAPGATLEWNPNPEPEVTGYRLYYGTSSGTYTKTVDAGNLTRTELPELVSGFTYYFTVTAYNSTGVESPPSSEVSFTVPRPQNLQFTYLPRLAAPAAGVALEILPAPASEGFAFIATGAEQTAVTIYSSNDLENWEVRGSITNPTGRLMIVDPDSKMTGRRFYRLKQVPLDPVVD